MEIPYGIPVASSFPEDDEAIAPSYKIPQGLSAVPDCIELSVKAPKPNFAERTFLSVILFCVHLTTWFFHLCNWIGSVFCHSKSEKSLYRQLHQIANEGIIENIEHFLYAHSEDKTISGFLFRELLDLPELYFHLPEILKGANICLSNDKGFFCSRWKLHLEAYQRPSSHKYKAEECYAIGHVLFWIDLDGNTRFQFEKSPLRGMYNFINHITDYIRYKRDNEQQGVTGSSAFTEHYCLKFNVDPEVFLYRKNQPIAGRN